jgi:hypothetical protein
MITLNPELHRPGQVLMADKGYRRASFETELTNAGITVIRPTFGTDKARPAQRFRRPFRQIIESVNHTLKAQLDLERHGGRTKPGRLRTRPATLPGAHRSHLAQRDIPTTRPSPQPHRLRPLTPSNQPSSTPPPLTADVEHVTLADTTCTGKRPPMLNRDNELPSTGSSATRAWH